MTCCGTVASHLGLPDAGLASYSDMVGRVTQLCAMQLDDQDFLKKCGHMLGWRVVDAELTADKIRVAVESRRDPNFLIIARTNARTALGRDEALRRAALYGQAGADILFVESPESVDEVRTICRSFDKPLLANMVEGGRTPILSRAELQDIGYRLAIFPATAFLAASSAFRAVYQTLKAEGSTTNPPVPPHDFKGFSQMMGFDWVAAFDARHARPE